MSAFPVPIIQDNLAADVRVETERRLKSLQKDLEKAETANKERALAVRYHKVKFFGQSASGLSVRPPLTGPRNRAAKTATENPSGQKTNAGRRRSVVRPSS